VCLCSCTTTAVNSVSYLLRACDCCLLSGLCAHSPNFSLLCSQGMLLLVLCFFENLYNISAFGYIYTVAARDQNLGLPKPPGLEVLPASKSGFGAPSYLGFRVVFFKYYSNVLKQIVRWKCVLTYSWLHIYLCFCQNSFPNSSTIHRHNCIVLDLRS